MRRELPGLDPPASAPRAAGAGRRSCSQSLWGLRSSQGGARGLGSCSGRNSPFAQTSHSCSPAGTCPTLPGGLCVWSPEPHVLPAKSHSLTPAVLTRPPPPAGTRRSWESRDAKTHLLVTLLHFPHFRQLHPQLRCSRRLKCGYKTLLGSSASSCHVPPHTHTLIQPLCLNFPSPLCLY